jgi:uncharacterized protein YqeY
MKHSNQINEDIKSAMKDKQKDKLEALRAVKTAFTLARTSKQVGAELDDQEEVKILQKLVKQRGESAQIYREQNRPELAEKEELEAKIISAYLPRQLDESEIRKEIEEVIKSTGASGMADMGKVMGIATKKMAGLADGKVISQIVREILSASQAK